MFLLMLLFTAVALMIPKEATAPALILIGLNMFSGLRKVDLANFTDGLPVLMMVMITLIANSFGTGIAAWAAVLHCDQGYHAVSGGRSRLACGYWPSRWCITSRP